MVVQSIYSPNRSSPLYRHLRYFFKYLYIIFYIYPSKNKWIINYSHSSQCIEKRKWSLDLSSTHASFGQNVSLAIDLKLRSSVKLKCFCRLAIVLALPDLTSCPIDQLFYPIYADNKSTHQYSFFYNRGYPINFPNLSHEILHPDT